MHVKKIFNLSPLEIQNIPCIRCQISSALFTKCSGGPRQSITLVWPRAMSMLKMNFPCRFHGHLNTNRLPQNFFLYSASVQPKQYCNTFNSFNKPVLILRRIILSNFFMKSFLTLYRWQIQKIALRLNQRENT